MTLGDKVLLTKKGIAYICILKIIWISLRAFYNHKAKLFKKYEECYLKNRLITYGNELWIR